MTIYRALRTLDTGKRLIEEGSVFPDSWLKPSSIVILTEQGKVSEALLPPVFALPPPFKAYSAKLSKAGITDAAQWMEADPAAVGKIIGVTAAKAAELQAQLYQVFNDPRRRG